MAGKKVEKTKVEAKVAKATDRSLDDLYEKFKKFHELTVKSIATTDSNVATLLSEVEKLREEVERFRLTGGKNRGPKSTRDMTEEDAIRVITGDLKVVPVRKAAEILGLSYGQVYSARGGYTFKYLSETKAPSEEKD